MADLLSHKEIERITGIPGDHPVKQRNKLNKAGIHCFINDARELVVFKSWVDAAALPQELLNRYIAKLPANDSDEDIGMNLEALSGSR
ncbi:MAG: hypothetical protein V4628_12270 [Pseudomonadota bacterium]